MEEINKVKRLFTGDDNTSIGNFFTSADYKISKLNEPVTVTTTDITQSYTSSITNINTETEVRLDNFSDELQSITQMLSLVLAQSTNNTPATMNQDNEQMQVEFEINLATKRKAGDTERSPHREQ